MKMKFLTAKITLFAMCLLHLLATSSQASTERRTALVIGNSSYTASPLKNPVNDATDMAATLTRLGFFVVLKKDANHQEMEEAIREFGEKLKKGGVGLFFYAGHGVQINGRNYLLPIGAKIHKETDIKFQAVDVELVLAEMGNADNSLNIVILDACRDNPYGRSFRSAGRGLAIVSDAPKGTFITYSTSPGKIASDGDGRNSPYAESLMRHMNSPGLPIEDVFKEVRKDMGRKTGGQQVPWELSSLEGKFYFRPGGVEQASGNIPSVDYDTQKRKITDETEDPVRKKTVEEERVRLENERRVASVTYPHSGIWEGIIETYGGLFDRPVILPIEVKVINDRFLSTVRMYGETRTLTGTVDMEGNLDHARLEGSVQKYDITGKIWDAHGDGRMGWKLRITLKKKQ